MIVEGAKQFLDANDIGRIAKKLEDVQQDAEKRPWILVEVLNSDLFSQIVVSD